jgi:oxygen-independent coproporphyrinogen-3 oxidase
VNAHRAPLHDEAVGLYIHIPFCDGKCRYCAFYSKPLAEYDATALVEALTTELDRYRAVSLVRTAYVGGGSPTCLPPKLLARIVEAVATRWPNLREFTVECNPGQTNSDNLGILRDHHVNRLSFGVQSFHPRELSLLGRQHSVEEAAQAIQQAQALGFDNVGLDLIFAIPGSTPASWEYSLRSAVALGVQHVSAYSLSFEPGTPLDTARKAGRIHSIDEETDRAMYELAIAFLSSAGLAQYEISNFARDGFACQHNQGYWRNRPYIGIGPSAGSYWQGRRTINVSDIARYMRSVEAGQDPSEQNERPSQADRICETAVLNLRTRDGIDLATFRQSTGADFLEIFRKPLRRYERQGLIEVIGDRVRLARKALAVADSVLCDFAAL